MEQAHQQNRWLDTPASKWSVDLAHELCQAISDDSWVVRAALATRASDAQAQLAVIRGGLAASDRVVESSQVLQRVRSSLDDVDALRALLQTPDDGSNSSEEVRQQLVARRQLLELADKTQTWQELYGTASASSSAPAAPEQPAIDGEDDADADVDVDASWQFDEDESVDTAMAGEPSPDTEPETPSISHERTSAGSLPLPAFLDTPLLNSALDAASEAKIHLLDVLFDRHGQVLSPRRLHILSAIPSFTDVREYLHLLPDVDPQTVKPRHTPGRPWRSELDWAEHHNLQVLLSETTSGEVTEVEPENIAHWCEKRLKLLDQATGDIDGALVLAQYAASHGLEGLDAAGEQLSLLAKLVYDGPTSAGSPQGGLSTAQEWSLERWSTSTPGEIVGAYLASSSEYTIADDIRRLVLPYLYVLESQLERKGQADPDLHDRLLYHWILDISSTRLELVAAVFQASKPSIPHGHRLIKNDEQLVRLAIASLYGFQGVSSWETMSNIYECMPAFSGTSSGNEPSDHSHSLASIINSNSPSPNASDIYQRIAEWPVTSLASILDGFELHLEAAETFARWSSPVPLAFFLKLSLDAKLQRFWADKLAQTSAAATGSGPKGARLGQDFEYEDDWISLLDDLCRLVDGGQSSGNTAAPVFGSLTKKEITRIFFSALLSSGKFGLARSLFNPSSGERPLDPTEEEAIVLAAARDFYDNAETGNLHSGNMKLAFECLSVAPNTPAIRKERDFIEATSRISSYKIVNEAGESLTPLEIRLTADRLSLVARLLSGNLEAYRHPDVILDLTAKLGYRGDSLAETRVLSMLAQSALRAHDTPRACDVCRRMVKVVEQIRRGREAEKAAQAAELAWQTCLQIGQDEEVTSVTIRKEMMGQAMLLCPASQIPDIISIWQVCDRISPGTTYSREEEHLEARNPSPISNTRSATPRPLTPSSPSIPHSASDAARAALSVGRSAVAYLPLPSRMSDSRSRTPSVGDRSTRNRSDGNSPASSSEVVKDEINRRLQRGIGWLIVRSDIASTLRRLKDPQGADEN